MPVSAEGSALRALRVLEAVGAPDGPHSLGWIAREAGVTKPSTHRILHGLAEAGYVATDGDGTYGPGPRAHALSALFAPGQDGEPVLRRLRDRTGQTVHVALRSGTQAVYVRKLDSAGPYRMASRVGGRIPLHCTAIGKAILAHLEPGEREALLAETGLPARTARTRTSADALEEDLARVRSLGYAVDDQENEESVRCVAAPLLDAGGRPVGGVSLSALTFSAGDLLSHVPPLLDAARLLAPAYT